MEVNVVNRLLALLIVATIAGGTAFSQNQRTQRPGNPPVRVVSGDASSVRSSSVPRPMNPSRKIPARLMSDQSILEPAPEESELIYEDAPTPMILGESYSPDEGLAAIGACSSCNGGGCNSCGVGYPGPFGFDLCNPGTFDGRQLCICLPSHGWASVEYLMWYQSGMETPALVTTSPNPTAQAQAGVLPLATTLYGGSNDILSDRLNGMRVRFGWWFVNNPNVGVEGEYVGTAEEIENFDRNSTGNPILARPFYNVLTGREDAELVAFPNVVSGRIRTEAASEFVGAAVRFRRLLCCNTGCGLSPITCGPVPAQSRIDATLGWRYFQLTERLGIREDLTSLDTSNPGSFILNDNFQTRNQFNGVELGVLWQGRRGYWSLDTLMRLNVGNTYQVVTIAGTTQATQNNNTTTTTGGLLAQRTNIGTYTRDQFGIVPELGATVGYQLTQHLRMTAGYSFIYWSNVVRPGDQIDTSINPNLLPPENPTQTTFLNPRFAFQDSDYWIQGLTLGGEYRW